MEILDHLTPELSLQDHERPESCLIIGRFAERRRTGLDSSRWCKSTVPCTWHRVCGEHIHHQLNGEYYSTYHHRIRSISTMRLVGLMEGAAPRKRSATCSRCPYITVSSESHLTTFPFLSRSCHCISCLSSLPAIIPYLVRCSLGLASTKLGCTKLSDSCAEATGHAHLAI